MERNDWDHFLPSKNPSNSCVHSLTKLELLDTFTSSYITIPFIYHFSAFSYEFASTLTIGFNMNLHPQPMKPKKPSLQTSCELAITTTQNSLQIHMKGRIVHTQWRKTKAIQSTRDKWRFGNESLHSCKPQSACHYLHMKNVNFIQPIDDS